LAFVTNIFVSILIAIIGQKSISVSPESLIVSLFVGCVIILLRGRLIQRGSLLFTGVLAGISAALITLILSILSSGAAPSSMLINAAWAALGGVLGAILCLGTLPVWESVFGILTPVKLLELSNQNHPLLKRLSLEAAGTHHHSIVVANLAERAADAIGANSLLTRVGAYYHDIGKLENPSYFAENQVNKENPHDELDPAESVKIIRKHPKSGYIMARKSRIAKEICDIILQHHGTMPIQYFYHKALAENPDAKIENFCYAGPKPQTREAAVIMMADCAEAAVRSLTEKNYENIRYKIKELIKERLDSGQFDECDLTLKELDTIAAEFAESFVGIYHDRVKYPRLELAEGKNK